MKDRGQTYETRAVVCFLWELGVKLLKNPSVDVGTVWSIHHESKNDIYSDYPLRSDVTQGRVYCEEPEGVPQTKAANYPAPATVVCTDIGMTTDRLLSSSMIGKVQRRAAVHRYQTPLLKV